MATSSIPTPKLSFSSPTLQTLYRKLPILSPLQRTTYSFSLFKLHSLSHHHPPLLPSSSSSSSYRFRCFSAISASGNGAEIRHYDFDLFTIGAGSGGVRASRFAAGFGASVAVCELPFATVSSETTGGFGGT